MENETVENVLEKQMISEAILDVINTIRLSGEKEVYQLTKREMRDLVVFVRYAVSLTKLTKPAGLPDRVISDLAADFARFKRELRAKENAKMN